MRLLTRFGALLALVLFGLASEHCRLEAMPLFSFLQCCCDEESQAPAPNDCGDTICASVESGHFRSEEQTSLCPGPVLNLALETSRLDLDAPPEPTHVALEELEFAPPELSVGWQFAFRAAVPPRAPSFVS